MFEKYPITPLWNCLKCNKNKDTPIIVLGLYCQVFLRWFSIPCQSFVVRLCHLKIGKNDSHKVLQFMVQTDDLATEFMTLAFVNYAD